LTSPFRGTEGWGRQVEKNLFAEASDTTCLVEENSLGQTTECPHCIESGLAITDVIAPGSFAMLAAILSASLARPEHR
jgi:hypothetical protein